MHSLNRNSFRNHGLNCWNGLPVIAYIRLSHDRIQEPWVIDNTAAKAYTFATQSWPAKVLIDDLTEQMLTNEASFASVLFVTSQTVSYYWRFPCPSDCDQYSVVQPQATSDEESPLGSVNHELPEKIKQSENGAADVQSMLFFKHSIENEPILSRSWSRRRWNQCVSKHHSNHFIPR